MVDRLLNFRCPIEMIDAIDALGQERHPANNASGCDRSLTLKDIIRAGIYALTNGTVVLPVESKEPKPSHKPQSVKRVRRTGLNEQRVRELIQ